jgi:hypothetical protein
MAYAAGEDSGGIDAFSPAAAWKFPSFLPVRGDAAHRQESLSSFAIALRPRKS